MNSISSKIYKKEKLLKIVDSLKSKGKKIVTYNGSFDIIHIGHIKSIQEAKEQGDVLIILLNSDQSVKSYKGLNRPIVSQNERAEILAAFEDVDYITIFDEINPKELLNIIKPNIHCNGSNWGKNCVERSVVEENGGEIYVLKWIRDHSTTNLIKKIVTKYNKSAVKAVFIDRDGTINLNKHGYIHKIEDFEFAVHSLEGLKYFSSTEFKIIIITNQSGIGRGYYTEEDYEILNNWMLQKLKKEGIRIDKVYYCPHSPADHCLCRKPNSELVMRAVRDFGISLNDSWIIGDDEKDIILGREINLKTIKIGKKMPMNLKLEPNNYAEDLLDASKIILSKI